ncbi:hypothetical protein M7I_0840 [Glarea lozoyensis 74030]|uniref:Uncharacterized protein n=1 Tax=Glarea lozoyensis (strain ATCC 74030 / MF5533) TaxID=1104152 RepID=H0EEG5_GLAL7|nr:hypothetical protein M7I_0840 [Glarea lozoyensis 74030]
MHFPTLILLTTVLSWLSTAQASPTKLTPKQLPTWKIFFAKLRTVTAIYRTCDRQVRTFENAAYTAPNCQEFRTELFEG